MGENDRKFAQQKADYNGIAINSLAEQALLDAASRADGYTISRADLRASYDDNFSQFNSRHILVKTDDTATDKDTAQAAALAKAQDIERQLKADPNSKDLW